MLKFIFGRPASGKTYNVLQNIKRLSEDGKTALLIVPEQFSFESERAVLKELGDKAALGTGVTTFTRLCDDVGRQVGGIAGITLSGADKVIFMNRALSSLEGELRLWSKYCRSVYFAKTILDTIGEFKINAVTPEDLRKAADTAPSDTLRFKLTDTALIYETFDALVGEQFVDPVDNLTKLYEKLGEYRYFSGKTVFFDSFKGFTGQQMKIIERVMSQADDIVFSFTNDPSFDKEYNVYTNVRKLIERIRRSAEKYNIKEDMPLVLGAGTYISEDIKALERMMAGAEYTSPETCGDITVCAGATMFDEAEYTARKIRQLVREMGYRYRDFVIIARDAQQYEEGIRSACEQNGIPCFSDKREPLSAFPGAAAVTAALEAAVNLSSENILSFHKTGLGTLGFEELSKLENYVYLWNINGELWQKEWDMDPKGFIYSEKENSINQDELDTLNALRRNAVKPLLSFRENCRGTAADMAEAAVTLLEDCGAAEKLGALSERFKNENEQFRSDILKQSYDKFMHILDSLARCFGSRNITKREFAQALELAVSLDSVGVIPRMLDEVTFGSADRIRPSRPRVAFIIGANQGVFPKEQFSDGIFALRERREIIEAGIDIPDNQISSVIDENYLVYCNLCCPSDKLFITYSASGLSGEEKAPSAFVEEIIQNLHCKRISEPSRCLTADNLPETAEAAYSEYCRRFNQDAAGALTLRNVLEKRSEYTGKLIDNFTYKSDNDSISPETAEKLFGSKIMMSASKFDTFHKCRFSFFCRYGLGAKKLQPADFDVLQRGTIVHFVLEKIIVTYKKDICKLSEKEINDEVDKYIAIYLDGIKGYRSVETNRDKFLVSRISRAVKAVVKHISEEFAQSDFEPVACELEIGGGDDMPKLNIDFDGGNIELIGKIDRLDEYNGYIRIIDYKTGTKKFKLPDVIFGLNLQMLIYLYSVVRGRNIDDEKAAGILYMPSKRDLGGSGMAMNGLLRSEKDIVEAMDKQLDGEYVPKYSVTTSGQLDKRCTSFINSENFSEIFDYIEKLMRKTGEEILSGDISAKPVDGCETPACKYCDFSSVCGRESMPGTQVPSMKNSEVFEKMREDESDGV